jgi:competence protein ComEA
MLRERTESDSAKAGGIVVLGRIDQVTIAVLLAIGLVVMGATCLWRQVDGNGVADIDHGPRRTVEFRIDVNRADWPEFSLLPGIGETIARRIVASREADGDFQTHDDLERVHGIGPAKLEAIRPYLLPIGESTGR